MGRAGVARVREKTKESNVKAESNDSEAVTANEAGRQDERRIDTQGNPGWERVLLMLSSSMVEDM